MKYSIYLVFFIFVSCSSSNIKIEPKQTDQGIYISSGVERFFLSQRPAWSSFSEVASCRQPSLQLLNFDLMYKNYKFDYRKMIFFQNMFEGMKAKKTDKELTKVDENKIFYEIYQQIDSGAQPFVLGKTKQVYVVVVDSYLSKNVDNLRKYTLEKLLPNGQVFFLSRCLTSLELNNWKDENNFYSRIESLGIDYFSIYTPTFEQQFHFSISLDKIIKNKKIKLITKNKMEARYINGYNNKWVY